MRQTCYPASMVLMAFLLFSCAGRQPQVDVGGQGEKAITINANSFSFEPNNIKAKQGDTIVLNITNTSKSAHNFTIKDPGGKILQSVDLPPRQTVPVTVNLTENGKYDFYCNKPFHPTMGMKGSIQAGAAS